MVRVHKYGGKYSGRYSGKYGSGGFRHSRMQKTYRMYRGKGCGHVKARAITKSAYYGAA